MSYEIPTQMPYPYNLLLDVSHNTPLELPRKWTPDVQAGFDYALSTLPDEERELVHVYYAQENNLAQTAAMLSLTPEETEALRKKAIQKLRIDSRWNYICYGIAGYLKRVSEAQYRHGFRAGFAEGRKLAHTAPEQQEDILDQPIDCLDISNRARTCLRRAGYRQLRDVIAIEARSILHIRNLGIKCAQEIAKALQNQGIHDSPWDDFLL